MVLGDTELVLRSLVDAGLAPPLTAAPEILCVERGAFDYSYLTFLDEQIELAARGPDWTSVLRARRDALTGWEDHLLLRADVRLTAGRFICRVDPETGKLIHREPYQPE